MSTVRCLILCLMAALAASACTAARDAELTTGRGATTSAAPTTLPPTTTTPPTPSTAPRGSDVPPDATTTTEAATTTSSTTTTTRPPVLSGPVAYSITGGIAGVSDRLTITADGAATYQSTSKTITYVVAHAQLMRLATALRDADFPSLRSVYGFAMPNGFEYRVTYESKTVLIFGSAEPARLKPALAILSQEMERGRSS